MNRVLSIKSELPDRCQDNCSSLAQTLILYDDMIPVFRCSPWVSSRAGGAVGYLLTNSVDTWSGCYPDPLAKYKYDY